jgi:hypothetical protein
LWGSVTFCLIRAANFVGFLGFHHRVHTPALPLRDASGTLWRAVPGESTEFFSWRFSVNSVISVAGRSRAHFSSHSGLFVMTAVAVLFSRRLAVEGIAQCVGQFVERHLVFVVEHGFQMAQALG